jgi:hypothetical protein
MHHFLKPVAIAVLAFAAVGAQAQTTTPMIDNGFVTGNGHFFFSVWDGNTSYTRGTNLPMDTLIDGVAAPGLYSFSLAADPLFLSWLRAPSTNIANIEWAATAIDTLGARRQFDTQQQGAASPTRQSAGNVRSYLGNVTNWIDWNNFDLGLSPTYSVVTDSANRAYGGNINYGRNSANGMGFFRHGTELNSSITTGLNLLRVDAASTGSALATYALQNDGGAAFPLRVWIDFDSQSTTFGQFNVAAVPEPETYAMLLAGLGLMGAIAARRRQRG